MRSIKPSARIASSGNTRKNGRKGSLVSVGASLGLFLCIAFAGVDVLHTEKAVAASASFGPSDYIVRFVQYVRWPADDATTPWNVCVTRNSDRYVDALKGASVHGRSFRVTEVHDASAISGCHVLDLTELTIAQAQAYLSAATTSHVFTMGLGSDFCSAGGIVCLELGQKESTFGINLSAVKRSGLEVNAQLLKLGKRPLSPEAQP